MPDYRDRNNNYVPGGLFLTSRPQRAELGTRYDDETETRVPVRGQVAHGLADELNRENRWQWADVSGDGTHWAHFLGHPAHAALVASRWVPEDYAALVGQAAT